MKTWRLVYTDGTQEDVAGSDLRVYENVLTVDLNHAASYDRRSRSWPLTSLRSWELL